MAVLVLVIQLSQTAAPPITLYNYGTDRKVPGRAGDLLGEDSVCRQHLQGGLLHRLAAVRAQSLQAAKRLRLT
jgi:hypothetical protein